MKLCVFLISYFMQGWAEDVAGMAYALRSLPEGAPCLPQVRASSGVPAPMGKGDGGVWWGRGGDLPLPSVVLWRTLPQKIPELHVANVIFLDCK